MSGMLGGAESREPSPSWCPAVVCERDETAPQLYPAEMCRLQPAYLRRLLGLIRRALGSRGEVLVAVRLRLVAQESEYLSCDNTARIVPYRSGRCCPSPHLHLSRRPGCRTFEIVAGTPGCRHEWAPTGPLRGISQQPVTGVRGTCWRWSIQACPHGRGGRPILPTPVVAAIKGLRREDSI